MTSTNRPGTTRYVDPNGDSTHFRELPIIQPVSGVPRISFRDVLVTTVDSSSRPCVAFNRRKTLVTSLWFTRRTMGICLSNEFATIEHPYHQAGYSVLRTEAADDQSSPTQKTALSSNSFENSKPAN